MYPDLQFVRRSLPIRDVALQDQAAPYWERAALGCLLENPDLWPEAELSADDFLLEGHRFIWQTIARLQGDAQPADIASVVGELGGNTSVSDYVVGLIDGVVKPNFNSYVRRVREAAQMRRFMRVAEQLQNVRTVGERSQLVGEMQEILADTRDTETIRSYWQIEEVMTVEHNRAEPIVTDLLRPGTVTLLSGDPGIGKSYLTLDLAIRIALGTKFLGRPCKRTKVLYVDYENPVDTVQTRIHVLAGGVVPDLKVWGGWLSDPPPLIHDPRLLQMVKADGPLVIVFDSFVRCHQADENDASEMRNVMGFARRLAHAGSTPILVHHHGKGGAYRGSTDILAGVDTHFSLERDGDWLKLRGYKSRDGELKTVGIRIDFVKGKVEASDTQLVIEHRDDLEVLSSIIEGKAGLSQNQIIQRSGLRRAEVLRLLNANTGKLWRTEPGGRKAILYYSLNGGLTGSRDRSPENLGDQFPEPVPGRTSTGSDVDSDCTEPVTASRPVPGFPTPKGGKPEQVVTTVPAPTVCRRLPKRRCTKHGEHRDWYSEAGLPSCRRCRDEEQAQF